jgi:TRAP-type C4-dicarboxylate transport system permease small subunit
MHTLLRWFWGAAERVALSAFICMLVLVTAQVFFRYVLQVSVPWTEEAARWFCAYTIFLGCAIAAREGLDVRTTLLLDRLPDRARAAVECVIAVGGLVFFGGIAYGGAIMMWTVSAVEAGSFRLSMSYVYVAIPVCFALLVLLTLRNLGRSWRTLRQSPNA